MKILFLALFLIGSSNSGPILKIQIKSQLVVDDTYFNSHTFLERQELLRNCDIKNIIYDISVNTYLDFTVSGGCYNQLLPNKMEGIIRHDSLNIEGDNFFYKEIYSDTVNFIVQMEAKSNFQLGDTVTGLEIYETEKSKRFKIIGVVVKTEYLGIPTRIKPVSRLKKNYLQTFLGYDALGRGK